MKVKELIKKLKKLDPDAEVVTHDAENGFYSSISVYENTILREWDEWISITDEPRPSKIVYIG